jgi:plastocyanin
MCCSFEPNHTDRADQQRGRRPLRSLIAIGSAVVVALAVAAAAMVAGATEPTHDITLVARDMAFYLPANARPNPPLEVTREEQVRLTLVNRDSGIDHDLAVTSLDVETSAIPGDGGSVSVEFRAPRQPGVHEYVCRLHGKMMRGQLTVR